MALESQKGVIQKTPAVFEIQQQSPSTSTLEGTAQTMYVQQAGHNRGWETPEAAEVEASPDQHIAEGARAPLLPQQTRTPEDPCRIKTGNTLLRTNGLTAVRKGTGRKNAVND